MKRSGAPSSSIPMTWARAACRASAISWSASIARRSSCFRWRSSAAPAIRAINGRHRPRSRTISSANTTPRCPGRARRSTSIPITCRCWRCARRHSQSSTAPRKPRTARDVLLEHYPDFTIEQHLRNFRWKQADDLAHYREGLVKAGVPYGKIALVKRAAD